MKNVSPDPVDFGHSRCTRLKKIANKPFKLLFREDHQRKDTLAIPRIAAHLLGENETGKLPQTLNQAQGDRDHHETRMQSRGSTRAATGINKPQTTTPRESNSSHAPANENHKQDRPRSRNREPCAVTLRSRNPRSVKI
ncbi:hypothetical protein Bca4012_007909 [Brassica carinata]|uniref:Uncharacterized protein n=1 Tax=Brassica carinata TaxID=52824 RepID=A0A8X7UW48_BRACI|nr:hypothetical protein Bca52824_038600 [Brassica carinata]